MAQPGGVQFTLSEIAARLGGDVLGDGQTLVRRIATLVSAGVGDIAFLANRKYKSQLQSTQAAAVILAPDAADAFAGPRIVTANPYAYYARVAALLNPLSAGFSGVHPSAVIASSLPASAAVGPLVSIGQRVSVGEDVVIHAGCSIGDDVSIGAGSRALSAGDDLSRLPGRSARHPAFGCGDRRRRLRFCTGRQELDQDSADRSASSLATMSKSAPIRRSTAARWTIR